MRFSIFFVTKYKCKPWIVSVIHTFWAKLNRNTHVHMMLTAGWIIPYNTFKHVWFLTYVWILASRRSYLLKHLTQRVKENLNWETQHNELRVLQNISTIKKWDALKSRYIHFSKKADCFEKVLSYIWRYLKRPVIAQSRIKKYENNIVTFEYIDKYDGLKKELEVDALEFLGLLIQHIPNKWFKMVYYSWIFAPRVKSKYLLILKKIIEQKNCDVRVAQTYRWRMFQLTWIDIWKCNCWGEFKKSSMTIPWYKTKYFDTW